MNKLLVFVWGQVTIFPLLAPVVVFALLWALHRFFLRSSLKNVNAALIFFAGLAITGYATFTIYTVGPRLYAEYLEKHGVETDSAVVEVSRSLAIPQFENRDHVTVRFTKPDGVEVKVTHQSEERRFYPPIEGVVPTPKVGDRLRIRYFPNAEGAFIVLIDPEKSRFGENLRCASLQQEYASISKRYKFQDYPTVELKAEYRTTLDTRLRSQCLSNEERETLRKELETIR